MKLSEIKGERVIETIAEIIEPIGNIMSDSEAKEMFQQGKSKGKQPIFKILPTLLKTHKNDIYKILATVNGMDTEEYIEQSNMVTIINDFSDVIMDDSIKALFTSAKPVEEEN